MRRASGRELFADARGHDGRVAAKAPPQCHVLSQSCTASREPGIRVCQRFQLREIFDALVRLHTERWRDRGEPGVFADARMVRWHRETILWLERLGLLRLYSLRLNGGIIAAYYSLIDPLSRNGRTQYLYLPAYSIQHSDLRPGTLLTAMTVEHAAQSGVETIDMLRGDEEYKKLWHTERTPTSGFVRYREALASRTTSWETLRRECSPMPIGWLSVGRLATRENADSNSCGCRLPARSTFSGPGRDTWFASIRSL